MMEGHLYQQAVYGMASLPSWEMSQPCALEVREGVLGLIHYFTDTIVYLFDEIILVFLSHCLPNSIMAYTDPY